MPKPILVGYDPRRADRAPVEFGVSMARLTGARLIVASVHTGAPVLPISGGPVQYAIGQVDEDLLPDCSAEVEELEAELREERIQVECRVLRGTSAARALHEAAELEDAGLVVVGSSRESAAGRVLTGTTGDRLFHGSPCPVAVVPRDWTAGGAPAAIGVAFVKSEEGREALRDGHALARRLGATLRVITVVKVSLRMYVETEPSYKEGQFGKQLEDVEGEHKLKAERELREAVSELAGGVPVETEVLVGEPAELLVDFSRGVDLLVCGSRGYGPVRSVLLGSVTRRVTAEAHCPVIVPPRGVKASLEALVTEAPGAATAA